MLISGDFDPALRAAFPGAVRAALNGDRAPLLRLGRRSFSVEGEPPPPRLISTALFTATTCEEMRIPWPRTAPPDPAERRRQAEAAAALLPDQAFLPFDRASLLENDLLQLCDRWPASPVEPTFGPGPLPDVPVLLLEGEEDLRTPVEGAQRVAAQFPQAKLVVAPDTGHSALGSDASGCTERAFGQLLPRSARVDHLPARPPRVPAHAAAADARCARSRRRTGVGGTRGRALTALALTLRDVGEDSLTSFILDERDPDLARGGGLRARALPDRREQRAAPVRRGLRARRAGERLDRALRRPAPERPPALERTGGRRARVARPQGQRAPRRKAGGRGALGARG